MKNFFYLILCVLLSSCNTTATDDNNKPYIILELQNNTGKEIIIECPNRFKSQKIKATNGKHFLDFEVGDLVYIYDSKNKNYRLMDGSKKESLILILNKAQQLVGDYSLPIEKLTTNKNSGTLAIREYIKLLKKPYAKIFASPQHPFDYGLYKEGIETFRHINDSILKTDIDDNTKINILFEALKFKLVTIDKLNYYLSDYIDTLKVSKPLLHYFNKRKNLSNAKFSVGDTIPFNELVSSNERENINLNKLDKEINILFFTAKWCGNCKEYIEPLKNIQKVLSDKVDIFAINFDDNEKDYKAYQKGLDFKFVGELVPLNSSVNGKNFSISSLPSIVIIDKNKKVLLSYTTKYYIEKQVYGLHRNVKIN